MKNVTRPLTKRMISKLKECREMELNDQPGLCPLEHFSASLPGLYARGLINLKMYPKDGKELMGVCLNQSAINLLTNLDLQEGKAGSQS